VAQTPVDISGYQDSLNNAHPLMIGVDTPYGSGFELPGFIDEVSIFNTALTSAEVVELYNAGTALDARDHSQSLGSELIDNGDFTDGEDGWTVNADSTQELIGTTLKMTSSSWLNSLSSVDAVGTNGRAYEFSLDASDFTAGTTNGYLRLDGVYDSSNIITFLTGANTIEFVAYRDFTFVTFYAEAADLSYTIDNVSVKEVQLQGYWRNNGTDDWDDLSNNSNDGTVNGSPDTIILQEGVLFGKDSLGLPMNRVRQKGLNLDGTGYVEVADDDTLDFGMGDFTIEAWVKYDYINTGSSYNVIYCNGDQAGDTLTFALFTTSTKGGFIVGGYSIESLTTPTTGEWIHIVGKRDGDNIELYIDTESQATRSGVAGKTITNSLVKSVGRDIYTSRLYKDLIDDVRIYDRALSAKEIKQNYKAGLSKHKNTNQWSDDTPNNLI
jgi:hypothetical protein